jgi:PAS domain S-box-containing protein
VSPLPAAPEREALYEAIVRTSVDAIITIDEQGQIESVNPATERMFGYDLADLVGQNIALLMPSPHREGHDAYLQRYLRTGKATIIGIGRQVSAQRKDGTVFPVEISVTEVWAGTRRLFTGILHDITNRKKAEQAITQISEFERQQIGRELHDAIGQDMTGISLMAKVLAGKLRSVQPQLQSEAEDISNLASKVTQDVKRLAHGLYPTELEKHGLSFALRELAMNNEHLYRIRCSYEERVPLPPLSLTAGQHLYRIAQEASNNAFRHGGAKHILIRLERTEEGLILTVRDDGKGVPDKIVEKGGMGLIIMQYRTSALSGTFQIRRGSAGGTVVTCALPWPGEAERA